MKTFMACAILIGPLLMACASSPSGAGRFSDRTNAKDPWGNIYPAECAADLPTIPAIEVPQHFLDNATGEKSRYGLWSRIHIAYVLKGLDPDLRAATIRHEACHEQMWRLHGDPGWH